MHVNSPNNAGGVGIYCTYLTLVIISKLFLTTYMYAGVRIYGYQSRIWLLNMGCTYTCEPWPRPWPGSHVYVHFVQRAAGVWHVYVHARVYAGYR